jgi:aryl-alcohol dehydrogenase-like predicted oxidoreductase
MKYRRLGRTGLDLSEVGFGAWGIGGSSWIGAQDGTSVKALKTARDLGINFYDSALVYGAGHSEQLLAQTFGTSSEIVIATKIPPKNYKWPMPDGTSLSDAFPRDHVEKSLLQSLRNLKRESIDLLQFHVWLDAWADNPEWIETVLWLRRSGIVRYIGISVNDHQPENVLRALRTGLIDSVQVIYNIFEQAPEDRLLEYCSQQNIGVIGRVPFDEGSLTGSIRPESTFPEKDFRNRYFAGNRKSEVWKRAQAICRDLEIALEELPVIALQFCLAQKSITSVIPGMRTSEHAQKNAAAIDAGKLSKVSLEKLRRHRWNKNFYLPSPTFKTLIQHAIVRFKTTQRVTALGR